MSINPNKLLITSDFYSVQGEGISSGVPSYFVRLGICNLSCGMSKKFLNQIVKDKKLEDGEIFVGDLHAEGKATWTCDSTSQWAFRGEDKDFKYLIDRWLEQGLYQDISNGIIHIIWTGGEPTLPKHQEAIMNFNRWWIENRIEYTDGSKDSFGKNFKGAHCWPPRVYQEIETNGTQVIDKYMYQYIDQINCSPKLSNSGMPVKQRINIDAIRRIMEHPNYQFKFVISNEEDVQEIFRDFVVPFSIPITKVVCMPGLDDARNFEERTRFVLEMAKKYRFTGLTRLHIAAWDKTLNV